MMTRLSVSRRIHRSHAIGVSLSLVLLLVSRLAIADGDLFRGLGFLPGGHASFATGVMTSGSAVVGESHTGVAGAQVAFIWTRCGGMTPLTIAPRESSAHAVSEAGFVVGTIFHSRSTAMAWPSIDGPAYQPGTPGEVSSTAYASSNRVVVGSSYSGGVQAAYCWSPDTGAVALTPGVFSASEALGISENGRVIVGWGIFTDSTRRRAIVWQDRTTVIDLGQGIARAVSTDGRTVVGSIGPSVFVWNELAGLGLLGALPDDEAAEATSVSADGSVIVGRSYVSGVGSSSHPFVYDRVNGMRNLEVVLARRGVSFGNWTLDRAVAVSSDGRTIVGSGTNPGRQPEAWIATLSPTLHACPADLDDGSASGRPDDSITIDDLLYFLAMYQNGTVAADLDDGSATGTPDCGVNLSDLLYFLDHYQRGC
jgi:probable HAF family extracellular repeat protein